MGVLSALPFISAGNFCCCLWLIAGGAVATYLLQQNQSDPVTPSDGALVGLLAGLVGACVTLVLSIPIGILMAPVQQAMIDRVLEMSGTMPPAVREMLENSRQQGLGIGARILFAFGSFVAYLVLGAIFATLGGVLGALMFKRKMPAADSPS